MDLNADNLAGIATLVNSLFMWPVIQNLKKIVESLKITTDTLKSADESLSTRVTKLEGKE